MANTIKIKRGSNANLPSLNEAELAFTTDTKQLYAGTTSGNKELFKDIPFPTGGRTGELLVKKSDADYDTEWQDLLGKVVYKYKRRIMVGDDLDNRTIYFTFPDDYVPTTTGTMGHAIISGQYSSIWEQPYSNDPMDTEILISGLGLLRTISKPKDSSAKLTSTNIGVEEIGEVTAIDDSNPSYRHCYIEDSNIRPIRVGDVIGNDTKFYFTFPDNLYTDTRVDWSSQIFNTTGSSGFIYMSMGHMGDDYSIYGYFANTAMETIYQYTNSSIINKSFITCGSQAVGEVDSVDDYLGKYVLVDKRTLGNNARKLDMTLDNLL